MHLPPFRAAIDAGVAMVMTGHIIVPAWGEAPATLNPVALGRLRAHGIRRRHRHRRARHGRGARDRRRGPGCGAGAARRRRPALHLRTRATPARTPRPIRTSGTSARCSPRSSPRSTTARCPSPCSSGRGPRARARRTARRWGFTGDRAVPPTGPRMPGVGCRRRGSVARCRPHGRRRDPRVSRPAHRARRAGPLDARGRRRRRLRRRRARRRRLRRARPHHRCHGRRPAPPRRDRRRDDRLRRAVRGARRRRRRAQRATRRDRASPAVRPDAIVVNAGVPGGALPLAPCTCAPRAASPPRPRATLLAAGRGARSRHDRALAAIGHLRRRHRRRRRSRSRGASTPTSGRPSPCACCTPRPWLVAERRDRNPRRRRRASR